MGNDSIEDLLDTAETIREQGYGPWSRGPDQPERKDGAVIVTDNGNAYPACNVENVNYTNSTGALANATIAAVHHDQIQKDDTDIAHIAVATDEIDGYTFSGAHMQVLDEFADGEEPLTIKTDDGVGHYALRDLSVFHRPETVNGDTGELAVDSFTVPDTYHDDVDDDELVELAREARNRSYSPISEYDVGVAIRTPDGRAYTNANVENVDLGVTFHGEDAVRKAIAAGDSEFDRIVVSSPGDEPDPCAYCRQTLGEFGIGDITVVADGDQITEKQLDDLYPNSFTPSSLED